MNAPYFQLGQFVWEIFSQLYNRKDTDFDGEKCDVNNESNERQI